MTDNFVTKIIQEKLVNTRELLQLENNLVDQMLRECKRDAVQPAKDYWHKQDKYRKMVKTLETLLETELWRLN